jgi:hypothetical protein
MNQTYNFPFYKLTAIIKIAAIRICPIKDLKGFTLFYSFFLSSSLLMPAAMAGLKPSAFA